MADTYIANEGEIKDIRKRRTAVKTREDNATTREGKITRRETVIKGKEETLRTANDVKAERDTLQTAVNTLQTKIDEQAGQIELLNTKCNNVVKNMMHAYDEMTHIVHAVQILKYPVEGMEDLDEYRLDYLTPKQSVLIDALAEYGAKSAEKINSIKQAERMRTGAGLNAYVYRPL